MNHTERLIRNAIVVNLWRENMSVSNICTIVCLKKSQVNLILQWEREDSVLSVRSLGRPTLLSGEDLSKLELYLKQGSEWYEFTGDYWTHKRVKYVIEKEFGIIYEQKQVGRILKKIGWSRQKPQKKESKQDLEKVAIWKREGLISLKKKR